MTKTTTFSGSPRELVGVNTGVTKKDRAIGIEAFLQGILQALPDASP